LARKQQLRLAGGQAALCRIFTRDRARHETLPALIPTECWSNWKFAPQLRCYPGGHPIQSAVTRRQVGFELFRHHDVWAESQRCLSIGNDNNAGAVSVSNIEHPVGRRMNPFSADGFDDTRCPQVGNPSHAHGNSGAKRNRVPGTAARSCHPIWRTLGSSRGGS